MIVCVSRVPGDDDLCLIEAFQIRNANKLLRISARDAGGSYMFHSGGTACRYHSPFGSGHFSQAFTNPVGHLIVLYKVLRSSLHGGTDIRTFDRPADNGEGARPIDERLTPEGREN